ncbi:MAG: GntR family transcriptional regulator [Sedimentisphaerales bacterium]|nr:GntR family transcriptional regulator [Sedimentisphaerales bacterium]
MLLEIDHHSGVPIYRQVVDQIRQLIISGELSEGCQLESVRDLSARLKVNPMTISKAYSLLESENLLERRRGVGLFIAGLPREQTDNIKNELFQAIAEKTAIMAVQIGLTDKQVLEIIGEKLRELRK